MADIDNAVQEGVQEPTSPQTEPQGVTITPEQIQAAIADQSGEIGKAVEEYIAAEVKARLAGITPKRNTTDSNAIEQERFNKMSYKDRVKLFLDNPTVYNKLVNGGRA